MTTVSVRGAAATDGFSGIVPLIGRVLIAAIFVMSGVAKLANPAGTISYIQSAGLPLPEVAFGVAAVVEVIGGALLIVGYRTQLVAAVLAAFTLAAAFSFHFQLSDQNQFIHFWKNVAMAGGLLQVVAYGAGRLSLDNRS